MTKLKFFFIIFSINFFIINSTDAEALTTPEIPVLFYGTIKIDNKLVEKNTPIFVNLKTNNNQIAFGYIQSDGNYFLEVPCKEHINENILFKINNFISVEQQCVDAMIVPKVNLDLTFLSSNGNIFYNSKVLLTPKVVEETLLVEKSLPVERALLVEKLLPKVLSVKIYTNGTLLRSKDKKIFVIKKGKKQHIKTLKELRKYYFGKKIYNVNNDILNKY